MFILMFPGILVFNEPSSSENYEPNDPNSTNRQKTKHWFCALDMVVSFEGHDRVN